MACKAPASQFMFVEYSKPVEPVKGQKRRRGGPSEVRAVSRRMIRGNHEMEKKEAARLNPVPFSDTRGLAHHEKLSSSLASQAFGGREEGRPVDSSSRKAKPSQLTRLSGRRR